MLRRMIERFRKPEPTPTHSVQLHRISGEGGIIYSWSPVLCYSEKEAREKASDLSRDNQWGNPSGWPRVIVTKLNEENTDADEN